MEGAPDTPTMNRGVRRPDMALLESWNRCCTPVDGHIAYQTRHVQARLSLCLVSHVLEEDFGWETRDVSRIGNPPYLSSHISSAT